MQARAARFRPSAIPSSTRASGRRWRRRHASGGGPAVRSARCSEARPGRRGADRAADVDDVFGAGAVAAQHAPPFRAADRGRADDQRSGRGGDVAADQRRVVAGGPCQERVDNLVDIGDEPSGRQRQREQGAPRRGAHGRQIAQVDGERLVPDIGRRAVGAVEVHAFDQRVGGQDRERAAVRLDDRRVVSDAGHHLRAARGDPLPDVPDDGVLADIGDGWRIAHDGSATARTPPSGSRGSP